MSKFKDLTGKRYDMLVVIKRADDYVCNNGKHHQSKWLCKCDCGNYKIVYGSYLKTNRKKSCGCISYDYLKKYNEYEYIDKNTVRVFLTNCDESFICDADDWEWLKKYCWSKTNDGYQEARINGKNRLFHHMILPDCPHGMVRDHINLNKMDNRKENLRIVTYSVNNYNRRNRNKYGYKGITKSGNNYYVVKHVNGKKVYHGGYKILEEAIERSKELYGCLSESI